ncbi:MAG: hypothetical protein ACD_62C00048G0006, partial [uncultured bacterium]
MAEIKNNTPPYVRIDARKELKLLKQLKNVIRHDTPPEPASHFSYGQVDQFFISQADIESAQGNQILQKLKADNLLPNDSSLLSKKLSQYFDSLFHNLKSKHDNTHDYLGKKIQSDFNHWDMTVYLENNYFDHETGYPLKLSFAMLTGINTALPLLLLNHTRNVENDELSTYRTNDPTYKYYQESVSQLDAGISFLETLWKKHPEECRNLCVRLFMHAHFVREDALATNPTARNGIINPQNYSANALSYLCPLHQAFADDPIGCFQILDTVAEPYLFDMLVLLAEVEPHDRAELQHYASVFSQYLSLMTEELLKFHHGNYFFHISHTLDDLKTLWEPPVVAPYSSPPPASIIPLLKKFPDAILEIVQRKESEEEIQALLKVLASLASAVPIETITEGNIYKVERIFQGTSTSTLFSLLQCDVPQKYIVPLVMARCPDPYQDVAVLYPKQQTGEFFRDERATPILSTIMAGLLIENYDRDHYDGIIDNMILPAITTLLKNEITMEEIYALSQKHQGGLLLALQGLDSITFGNSEEMRTYINWASSLLQLPGNNYPLASDKLGMIAGAVLLWSDPTLREALRQQYGENTYLAAYLLALNLIPANRLQVTQRVLPNPLPHINTKELEDVQTTVSFIHNYETEKSELIDIGCYNPQGPHIIILLNLIKLCDTTQPPQQSDQEREKRLEALDHLLQLFEVTETLAPPITEEIKTVVHFDRLERLQTQLNYLNAFCPLDAEMLSLFYLYASQTIKHTATNEKRDLTQLVGLIKSKGGQNLTQATIANLSQIKRFAEFLMMVGNGRSTLRTEYIKLLDVSQLAKELMPHDDLVYTVGFATTLDTIDSSLGKKLIQTMYKSKSIETPQSVSVTIENIDTIFAVIYVLTALDRELPAILFGDFQTGNINSLRALLDWLQIVSKISRLPSGDAVGETLKQAVLDNTDWEAIQASQDFANIDMLDLQAIEDLRLTFNQYGNLVDGDQLVVTLALSFVNNPLSPEAVKKLIEFARIWSQTSLLRTDHLHDIQGRYLMASAWAATRARDFLEGNYSDYLSDPHLEHWEKELAILGYPLRESVIGQLRIAKPTITATTTTPKKKKITVAQETFNTLSPEDQDFITQLATFSNADLTLNNRLFSDLRLDNVTTLEAFRNRINTLTQSQQGNDVLLAIFNNELKKPLDATRLEIEYDIFFALSQVKHSDPFGNEYRDLANFLGGRLTVFIKQNEESVKTQPRYQEIINGLSRQGFEIPKQITDAQKALYHLSQGNWDYLTSKISTKSQQALRRITKASDIDEKYESGILTRSSVAGSLPGYNIEHININGHNVATLITASRSEGARVSARIRVGGGIRESDVSAEFGNSIV